MSGGTSGIGGIVRNGALMRLGPKYIEYMWDSKGQIDGFTPPGGYVVLPGTRFLQVTLIGVGGSGGASGVNASGSNYSGGGGGGGSGYYTHALVEAPPAGTPLLYAVGNGGRASISFTDGSSGAGGASTLTLPGLVLRAEGGQGGYQGQASSASVVGGARGGRGGAGGCGGGSGGTGTNKNSTSTSFAGGNGLGTSGAPEGAGGNGANGTKSSSATFGSVGIGGAIGVRLWFIRPPFLA